jgi:hypothetical protein
MRISLETRRTHIAQWRASGLSQAAYCRQEGIRYHRFRSWYAAPPPICIDDILSSKPAFIELPHARTLAASCTPDESVYVKVTLPCGTCLHVHSNNDPQWVGRLAAGLRSC